MPTPNGVHVGPLDPNRAENFGQVGGSAGSTTARSLIRHHLSQYPPDLARALNSRRNDERSGDAIDREEAIEVVTAALEDSGVVGATISGLAVRGEDDADQWLTYTWQYPVDDAKAGDGVVGRSSKGAIPYDAELLPNSVERGDEATKLAKANKAGTGYLPPDLVEAMKLALSGAGGGSAGPSEEELAAAKQAAEDAEAERDALQDEKDDLVGRVEALESQIAALAAAPPAAEPEAVTEPEVPASDPPAAVEAADFTGEPWDGYDAANADDIARRLKETPADQQGALAEHVGAYERANANRSTVTQAADRILDRTPS